MNTVKTTILMALLMGVLVAVGGAIGGSHGASIMFVIAVGMNFYSYWNSDSMVLRMYNAREIGPSEAPELYRMVENLAARAELPMPRVCIIDSPEPNAFATGRNPEHAAVAVTTGIMRTLNYNELSGVVAHELAHVKHHDILISTIAATFATMISWIANMAQWAAIFGRSDDEEHGGFLGSLATIIIAPLAAGLIQMAISRSREFEADYGGGEICGHPEYLADALEKMEYYARNSQPMAQATPATAHMFIVNPLENAQKSMANLFSTHPQTSDRVARLRQQAREIR